MSKIENTPFKTAILALALGVLLIVSIVGAYRIWVSMEGGEMSTHGFIALIGGSILTLLVGGGLMALVFVSNRSGHDDVVARMTSPGEDDSDRT